MNLLLALFTMMGNLMPGVSINLGGRSSCFHLLAVDSDLYTGVLARYILINLTGFTIAGGDRGHSRSHDCKKSSILEVNLNYGTAE
jgi:hypothetical protein